jgi:HSP20 family protein
MFVTLTTPWSTNRVLERWVDEAFRSLDQVRRTTDGVAPVNVWHDDATVVVTAAVPGLAPDQFELGLAGDVLTIAGTRTPESGAEGAWIRRERSDGRFERAIQLPWPVDGERIEARLKDGILTVACPRAASDRPRTIAVQAA